MKHFVSRARRARSAAHRGRAASAPAAALFIERIGGISGDGVG